MEKRKREDEEEGVVLAPARAPDLHYTQKTGICYDVRFRYHSRLNVVPDNYLDPHPEDPRRTFRIYKTLAESGLLVDEYLRGASDLGPLMEKIDAVEASKEQLLLVHTQEHLNFVASIENMDIETLLQETERGDSIYVNTDSYLGAKLSCGGAIECCRAVVEKRVKNSLAVIRPPGHHAEPQAPGGFCLFSNVAVAAQVMLKTYPQVKRVVIVDWDIHHGNGTQKAFYEDDRVLYISLHRYQNGTFYPGTKAGGANKVGAGKGEGFNINIPWSAKGMTDGDYITAFYRIILPVCDEYNPDLVIISSGFDAADGDPIGQCHVSPMGYAYMTHLMKLYCDGKLVVCLEGGYNLDSISVSALAVTKVLLGEPPGRPPVTIASQSALRTIEDVCRIHSPYWKSLGPRFPMPSPQVEISAVKEQVDPVESLQQVMRVYEVSQLREYYNFTDLPFAGSPYELLPHQVVCTPNIYKTDKLLVVIHETPLIWATPDPSTGLINPNTSATWSPNFKYIKWAIDNGYGVVDIFFPPEELAIELNLPDIQDVIIYIWDYSIRHFSATNIAFAGFGQSYGAMVHLAGHRDLRQRCEALIAFVCNEPLKQIVPALEEGVVDWFYRTSLVFANHTHKCWDNLNNTVGPKRPRKRMGRVLRTDADNLFEMIEEKFEETVEFMLDV